MSPPDRRVERVARFPAGAEWPPAAPLVATDETADWRATKCWSPGELLARVGARRVNVSVFPPGPMAHPQRVAMNVAELVEKLASPGRVRYYLQECLIDQFLPELAGDLCPPPSVASDSLRAYFWMGWTGSRSKLHYDDYHSALTQVQGYKFVRLYPPLKASGLHPNTVYTGLPLRGERVCVLRPGEMLLIPTGWWHEVVSYGWTVSVNFCWPGERPP